MQICLPGWIDAKTPRIRHHGRRAKDGLRFAFYGRVSTKDYQDPVSSRRWQLDVATELIAGRGRIVAEFFDVGYTRELSWTDRPQGRSAIGCVADPDQGFNAIVVGEYARAFSSRQILHLHHCYRSTGCRCGYPRSTGRSTFRV